MPPTTLASYLRALRSSLQPADVGLTNGGQRRVPGLRREEVAELVGLSTDYYVRLEQGRARRPSRPVIDAIARALRLSDGERAHLLDLAHQGTTGRPAVTTRSAEPRSTLSAAVAAINTAPALLLNHRTDVLDWNPLAALLIADFPALPTHARNMARLIFLARDARERHPDWARASRETVGILRMASGHEPLDDDLNALIDELIDASREFRRLWSTYNVHEKTHGEKRLRHPTIGELVLSYESFAVPGPGRLMLVIYPPLPESREAELLAEISGLKTHVRVQR